MARNVSNLLDKLARDEDDFLRREFLAPVLRGQGVNVRISGIRVKLAIEPADFEGWGVFQPLSHTRARHLRDAKMKERLAYLQLLPAVSMIACLRQGDTWLALPSNASDSRFQIEGVVPVQLSDEIDPFETLRCRFDGAQFWYDSIDDRADPGLGEFLRAALLKMQKPASLERPGLGAQQRLAYAAVHAQKIEEEVRRLEREKAARRMTTEGRLRDALEHAGAELREFVERGDAYRVSFHVDGARHTSVINRRDLTVMTAGVCLSGQDANFDLTSLVGVLREGHQQGEL